MSRSSGWSCSPQARQSVAVGGGVRQLVHAEAAQLGLDLPHQGREARVEVRREEVAHAQAVAGDLPFIGGTDAPRGGADLAGAARLLPRLVEPGMAGKQDVRPVRDEQPAVGAHAGLVQTVQLGEEGVRRDDHAVAQDAEHPLVQDAGRYEVQREVPVAEAHGVPRVVPPLVAHHSFEGGTEEIDDLPFPSSPHCIPTMITLAMA